MVLLLLFLPQAILAAPVKEVRRVLVFYEVGPHYPAIALIDQGISDALRNSPYQIELYREYLDTALFPDPATQGEFREWYRRKYRDRKPDIIIAVGPSALEFMIVAHEAFFRDVPVVFCTSTEAVADRAKLDSHFTGMWDEPEPVETLEVALRLKPDTKHVFVVGGTSPYDRSVQASLRERLQNYESKLDFEYLTDLAMPQLLDRIRHLPDHSVVLYLSILRDAAGASFIDATEAGPMVAQAASAPVFTFADLNLGHGEAGGYVINFSGEGKVAGATARRILRGEKPQDIPIARNVNVYMFDWRALKRWGLSELNLPPGSLLLYRQPTLWQSYKRYILGGISLILAETLLIVGLMWQRARRRQAEVAVRESEERFRLVANKAPVLIWMSGPDKLCTYFNQPWLEFTGRSIEAELGNGWTEGIHPEDLRDCLDTYNKSFDRRESFEMQYRLRRNDGEYRWVFEMGVPRFNPGNSFAGYIGSCIDVTERKMAEEALASLSGRLIDAQEEERKRIAREIHDDYSQRLALLSIDLEDIAEKIGGSSVDVGERLHQVWNLVGEIGADLHSLSHRLHSSTLESLGLVAGAKAFCQEFASQQEIQVDFAYENIPHGVRGDVALCLFRVVQEGLRNIKRHSGAARAEVRLECSEEKLHLSIADQGRGFDVNKGSPLDGIGIRSMEERLRSLGGRLEINSRPMEGTRIDAWLPLEVTRQRVA